MLAGSGIVHEEMPADGPGCHFIQLWINLPQSKKMIPSQYQDRGPDALASTRVGDATVTVLVGPETETHVECTVLDVSLDAAGASRVEIPSAHNGFAYCLSGTGTVGGAEAAEGTCVLLDKTDASGTSLLTMTSAGGGRFLLVHGRPTNEPVVSHGPFVATSRDGIVAAFRAYQAGTGGFRPFESVWPPGP